MNEKRYKACILGMLFCLTTGYAETLEVTVVSPLDKVFRDTVVTPTGSSLRIECASNEFESAQFVIRSQEKLERVSIFLSDLTSDQSGQRIPASSIRWRFVGYVPVERNTTEAECGRHQDIPKGELIRLAPFDSPDPLLEDRTLTIAAGQSQPVWLTVHVPKATPAGTYRGGAVVETSAGDAEIPIELLVYPFEMPDERHLYLTNWFELNHIARAHRVEPLSEEFWSILQRYAKDFAEHHQNVIYTPWRLIRAFREKNGELSFDYTNFDRFVQIFLDAGTAERIEIQHVAHHGKEGRAGREILLYPIEAVDRETGEKVSLRGDQGMEVLLRNLHQHLKDKAWIDRAIIHVADEPSFHNRGEWKAVAQVVRENLPGVKTIDAIGATGFEDALDILVPLTRDVATWFDDFKRVQAAGTEVWFYTCCSPWGYYANRFLDYHLSKTRILHWMNYSTGTEGFLHWGLTYGWNDPFGPAPRFPPGDSHIIYPGKDGPMSSMRWEMLREGMEDYEYLWLLENKTRAVMGKLGIGEDRFPANSISREICGRLVRSLTDYETDPGVFYATRRALAEQIVQLEQSPVLLVATDPSSSTELVTGPATVKVYGFVEKGATLKINGSEVEIGEQDGSFLRKVRLSWSKPTLTLEAEKDKRRKVIEQEFRIK
jgi:hypothetical protein